MVSSRPGRGSNGISSLRGSVDDDRVAAWLSPRFGCLLGTALLPVVMAGIRVEAGMRS